MGRARTEKYSISLLTSNDLYFTYIIESQSTARWYDGHTKNIVRRIHEHNTNHTKSSRNKGPWKIIFIRPFPTRQEAANFEMKPNFSALLRMFIFANPK